MSGEQFLQENRNHLSPEQQEEMQRKIDELRGYFDQVDHRSEKINTDTQQTVDRLEKELEEEVGLDNGFCWYSLRLWLAKSNVLGCVNPMGHACKKSNSNGNNRKAQ